MQLEKEKKRILFWVSVHSVMFFMTENSNQADYGVYEMCLNQIKVFCGYKTFIKTQGKIKLKYILAAYIFYMLK